MPNISIIIPVYNSEKFLTQCIESLINQTLKKCEFIFINDGSTDGSKEIIESYIKKDDRIILFNQDNNGVSTARNEGLKLAKGEYIGFVDSDDYIEPNMYEILYRKSKEANVDILISDYYLERDKKFVLKDHSLDYKNYSSKEIKELFIPSLLSSEELFPIWTNIYKGSFIKKNKIHFPKDIVIEEDALFNMKAFLEAENVLLMKFAGYYYCNHEESVSRKVSYKNMFKRALEKYFYDYKLNFNLNLTSSEVKVLKAKRFFEKVNYIIFQLSINKNYSYKQTIFLVKDFLQETHFIEATNIISQENLGKFQHLIRTSTLNKKYRKLFLTIFLIKNFYNPKISEILRSFN